MASKQTHLQFEQLNQMIITYVDLTQIFKSTLYSLLWTVRYFVCKLKPDFEFGRFLLPISVNLNPTCKQKRHISQSRIGDGIMITFRVLPIEL